MNALLRVLTALTLVASTAPGALDPDRLGLRQPPDLRLLNQALVDTMRGYFLSAQFKVANARQITPLGRAASGHALKEILLRTEAVLKDAGLEPVTKAAMALDHLATAIPMVIDYYAGVARQKEVPGAVIRLVVLLENLVPAARLDESLLGTAASLGGHAASLAEGLGAGVTLHVGVALDHILELLSDDELEPIDREIQVSRLARLVVDSVRRSRAFQLAR